MNPRLFIPHPALADLVNAIMVFSADLRGLPQEVVNPFPPTPEHYLYFYLGDPIAARKQGEDVFEEKPGSMLVGAQTSRVDLSMGKKHAMLAVVFYPGGLHRLLGGLPMQELMNADCDSTLFLGAEIRHIREQLQNEPDIVRMKEIVENWLLGRLPKLKPLLPFDHAIRISLNNRGLIPVEQLSSVACTGVRQFERQFLTRVGIPPKTFSRIARFSAAYRFFERDPGLNWTSIAHATGYFDQMHLIRDFKTFAGMVPTRLAAELDRTPLRLQAGTGG